MLPGAIGDPTITGRWRALREGHVRARTLLTPRTLADAEYESTLDPANYFARAKTLYRASSPFLPPVSTSSTRRALEDGLSLNGYRNETAP